MSNITLYTTSSAPEEINKALANNTTLSGHFREEVSVLRPVVLVEHEIPVAFNYAYIQAYDRYYYIDDIVSVRTNLWELHLRVDVLMSHKNGILNSSGVISSSEGDFEDMYLSGSQWVSKVKHMTEIMQFPQGFSETPYFILITAGGIVS